MPETRTHLSFGIGGDQAGADAAFQNGQAALGSADNLRAIGQGIQAVIPNGTVQVAFGESLSVANILEGALDAGISSGINAAYYGTDFGDSFGRSLVRSVVALGLADTQNVIGNILENGANSGEGSLGHIVLHGIAGCAAAEAQGPNCAAGATAGIAEAIYAGTDPLASGQTPSQIAANAQLIGAVSGYFFSGGDAENVGAGASIAQSASLNNYLSRPQYEQLIDELEACDPDSGCNASAIIDRWAQVSEDQILELLACETAECVTGHLEIIAHSAEIAEAFARTTHGHELISNHQNSGAYIAKYLEARGPRSLLTPYEKFQASSCGSFSDATCESMYQRKIEREFGIFMLLLTGAVPIVGVAEGVASCAISGSVSTCVVAAIDAATPGRIPSVRIVPNRGFGSADEAFDAISDFRSTRTITDAQGGTGTVYITEMRGQLL